MYLSESDFPISIRNTKDDYIIFSSKGQSVLKLSRQEWSKFTPNPSLTRFCTSVSFAGARINYSDISFLKHQLPNDEDKFTLTNIVLTMMAVGVINQLSDNEYIKVLIQLVAITQ